jgi:tetratricopeptide (TPR) repeat protein
MPNIMQSKLSLRLLIFWFMAVSVLCWADVPDNLNSAQVAFDQGRADDALRTLDAALQSNSANAAARNLQCRIYLAQERWNDAVSACHRAVRIAPDSSEYHLWLGRAYGEKASRENKIAAYRTAKLVRAEFEAAVALDGQNREALSDLGEYYVEAPKILGGGVEKAQGLADRLDPVRADELRARIAESKKDYAGAEQLWRARIAESQAPRESPAQAWMDLGSFYRRRGQWDEMLAALKSGAAADTNHGPPLVDGASTLIAARREPMLAAQWLREYLNGNALSDAAPAFAVHTQLGDLLRKQGDVASAEREYAAAHALSASRTQPAAAGY